MKKVKREKENDVNVILTISWSTPDSFEWCFDGEPMGGVVAVSSVGATKSKLNKQLFIAGYNAMLERLEFRMLVGYIC